MKQIVSPIVFDNLRNAVAGGLYDPAMGPLEHSGQCATCKQGYMACPGHFGHIELAVPVYNPLVFTTLFKLLRCTCLHCYKLKMAQAEVRPARHAMTSVLGGMGCMARSSRLCGHHGTACTAAPGFQGISVQDCCCASHASPRTLKSACTVMS